MTLNELTPAALAEAAPLAGDGPVVMVNLLWFRDQVEYPAGFEDAKPDPRRAYYEGYAGAFMEIVRQLGIAGVEVVYAGTRIASLVAGPDEDWDEIAVVRYPSYAEMRRILECEPYHRLASPHRVAGVANWRFFATQAKQ